MLNDEGVLFGDNWVTTSENVTGSQQGSTTFGQANGMVQRRTAFTDTVQQQQILEGTTLQVSPQN